jgi:hypothetical protein
MIRLFESDPNAAGSVRPRRIAVIAVLFMLLALARAVLADSDAPLPPDEVRERRLVREERPLWQTVLALPNDALLLLGWPLKHTLFWAERVNLPDRIADFWLYPVHHLGPKEDSH